MLSYLASKCKRDWKWPCLAINLSLLSSFKWLVSIRPNLFKNKSRSLSKPGHLQQVTDNCKMVCWWWCFAVNVFIEYGSWPYWFVYCLPFMFLSCGDNFQWSERVLELSEIKFVWFLRSWLKILVPSIISLFSGQNAVSLSPFSLGFPIPGVYVPFFHHLFVPSFLLMLWCCPC